MPDILTEEQWRENVIKYPAEGELIPAGPIYLQWDTSDPFQTIVSYDILLDGILADKVERTTDAVMEYGLYTTNVAMHYVVIRAVHTDRRTTVCKMRKFYVSKKGCGIEDELNYEQLGISWYYNWRYDRTPGMREGLDYVPQIWGSREFTEIGQLGKDHRALLGFQEPDFQTQSNVKVDAAIEMWSQFVETGLRLGSPCTAIPAVYTDTVYLHESSKGWFYRFMKEVGTEVDFIVVHDYDDGCNADTFLKMVDRTWNTWHKPIWITEFGVACWCEDRGCWDQSKKEQVYEFMKVVLPELDKRSFVERYAWYSFDETDEWGGASAIFDHKTGGLNELGRLYASLGLPQTYA